MIIVPSIAEFLAYRDYGTEITSLNDYLDESRASTPSGVAQLLGVSDLRVKAILRMLSALDLVSRTIFKGAIAEVRSTPLLEKAAASLKAKEVLWNLEVASSVCFSGDEFERTTLLTIAEIKTVLQGMPEVHREVNGTLSTAKDDLKGVVVTRDQTILLNSQENYCG